MSPLNLENEVECKFMRNNFLTQNYSKNTYKLTICKITVNDYPYCLTHHIRMNHEKHCCKSCGECFIELLLKKDHKKKIIKCDNCNKYLKGRCR